MDRMEAIFAPVPTDFESIEAMKDGPNKKFALIKLLGPKFCGQDLRPLSCKQILELVASQL